MEVSHNSWALNAPQGAIPEDVSKSEFWQLVSEKLRPFDKFEVLAEDGTWLVRGIIQSCARNWAQVFITDTYELGEMVAPDRSERFRAEWKGPEKLWCVIRNSDGAYLQEQLENAVQANAWLAEHESKVG